MRIKGILCIIGAILLSLGLLALMTDIYVMIGVVVYGSICFLIGGLFVKGYSYLSKKEQK